MSDSRKDLPSVNSSNFLARVRETLQGYLGSNGNVLDRGVTVRDLSDAGIVRVNPAFLSGGMGTPIIGVGSAVSEGGGGGTTVVIAAPSAPAYVPDNTKPPAPTGFSVGAGLSHLQGGINAPAYSAGHGHDRSRLYGATYSGAGLAPTFTQAVELTQFTGKIFAYPTEPSTTWHLWVTHVSKDGVESDPAGGTNGAVVTTGQDVSRLLGALSGRIESSQLAPALSTSLLDTEINAATAYDTAMQASGSAGWLGNTYTVRTSVSVDDKTLVGGFGLSGTSAGTQGPSIDFGVVADKFWIGAPTAAGVTGVSSVKPFVVQTTDSTVNGVLIPKGVYMDAAYIKNLDAMIARLGTAWIKTAMIANAQIVDAHIANLSAEKITAGLISAERINGTGLTIKNAVGDVLLDASGEGVPPWVVQVDNSADPGAVALAAPRDASNRARIRSLLVDNVALKARLTPSNNSVEITSTASEVWRMMYATPITMVPADGVPPLDYAFFDCEAGRVYSVEVRLVGRAVSSNTSLELYFQSPAGTTGTLPNGTAFTGGDIVMMSSSTMTTTGTTYINPTVLRLLVITGATAGRITFYASALGALRLERGTEFRADRVLNYKSPLLAVAPVAAYVTPTTGAYLPSVALQTVTGQPYQATFTATATLRAAKDLGQIKATNLEVHFDSATGRVWAGIFMYDLYPIVSGSSVRFNTYDFAWSVTGSGGTTYTPHGLYAAMVLLTGYTSAEADRWEVRTTKKTVSLGPATSPYETGYPETGDRTEAYYVGNMHVAPFPTGYPALTNWPAAFDGVNFAGSPAAVPTQAIIDYTVEVLFMGAPIAPAWTLRAIFNFI